MVDVNFVSVFLVACFVTLCIYYIFKDKRKKAYPRGPWGVPVFGHLPFLHKYPATTFEKWRRRYGDVFSMRTGSWKTVVLNRYDVIKAASECEGDVFSDRLNFATFTLQKDIDDGVFTLTSSPFSETYVQGRKIASVALGSMTKTQNPTFVDVISSSAKLFYSNILSKGNNMFKLDSDIHKAVGTIIYKIVYGRGHDEVKVEKQIEVIVNLSHETKKVLDCGNPADVIPWLRYLMPLKFAGLAEVLKTFSQFGVQEVMAHKRTFEEDQIGDITDYFVDYERKQKGKAGATANKTCMLLYNCLKELFAAGFDTSCTTLKWLFLFMIAFPEVQQKIQMEIDDAVGTDRDVELGDREYLHYTMAVVNEVMRLSSIVPFAIPHKALGNTKFMGFDIDEGTYILFNLHSINHDKEYWGDPEAFRPERLLDDSGRLDKETCNRIVPFGLGRRRCVGERLARMQVFILFATALQHCKLRKPVCDVIDLSATPSLIYEPKPYRVLVSDRRCDTMQ